MENNEPVTTIEYKDGLLTTTMIYPKKNLEITVGGVNYVVGWDGPNHITQVVTKDNIPTLLDYLKEQFALVNGRYEESKKQLAEIGEYDDKLAEAMSAHSVALRTATSEKELKYLLKKMPMYGELVDKVLRRNNLKKAIADVEPSVKKLKEQIDQVLSVIAKLDAK
jgi:hypothetical protein